MKVFVIPHFHYDLEWVRTKEEFAELALSNMEKVLEIMRKDKEFKYLFDQLFLLELFKERKPELWNELLERIREGRIELVGGIYLMPDNLIPGLETQIREILYAKPVMEGLSGKKIKIGWMIDCFGHHSQIPQIFKKAGFEFYTFKRGYRGEKMMNFIWEGLDGSKIFVHYMLFGYDPLWLPQDDVELGAKVLLEMIEKAKPYALNDCIMLLTGSDFTPPNPILSKIVKRARGLSGYDIKVATPGEYFEEVKNCEVPIVRDEMVFGRYHPVLPGCRSSRMNIKIKFRKLEFLLQSVEALNTFVSLKGGKSEEEKLEKAWKLLLMNAFHDTICGCGIDEIYKEAEERFREAEEIALEVLNSSLSFFSGNNEKFLLFNPLPWKRREIIELADGKIVSAELPPLGYIITEGEKEEKVKKKKLEIENEFFRVKLTERGTLDIFMDGKLVIKDGNDIEIISDGGDLYYSRVPERSYKTRISEAISKPEYLRDMNEIRFEVVDAKAEKSKFREVLSYTIKAEWRKETILRLSFEVQLTKGIPRIDFKAKVYFNYPHTDLMILFPTDIEGKAYAEIPGGVCEVDLDVDDSDWVEKYDNFAVQNWMAYEDGSRGVALINLGIPEHRIEEGIIKMTLLRSVDLVSWGDAGPKLYTPKALMIGEHEFRYALIPYKGSWKENDIPKLAYSHNAPVFIRHGVRELPETDWALELDDNLVMTAFKKSKEGIVLRFFETLGKETKSTMKTNFDYAEVYKADLLESPLEEWNFEVKPFEIVTLEFDVQKATNEKVN